MNAVRRGRGRPGGPPGHVRRPGTAGTVNGDPEASTHRWPRLGELLRARRAASTLECAILAGVIATGMGAALVAFNGQIDAALQGIRNQVAAPPGNNP